MNILKKLTLLIFLCSCSISPYTIELPQEGSYQLVKGVRDGCDTAHSTRGNGF